ncbi:MAG: hypothetical protein R3Y50_07010 [Rikenellaceae bacterium]
MNSEDSTSNNGVLDTSFYVLPRCGEGELLMQQLKERLTKVRLCYSVNRIEYEINTLKVITRLYGVDIVYSKVAKCINNLLEIVEAEYLDIFGDNIDKKFIRLVKLVFEILWMAIA